MPSYSYTGTGGMGLGATVNVSSPFAKDTFQDAAGTLLSSHVATPYGGTWTKHPSFAATAVISGSQRARPSSVNAGVYYFSLSPPSRDHSASATVYVGDMASARGDGWAGVACRVDTSTGSMYVGRLFYNFGLDLTYLEIGKYNAGSYVVLASTPVGYPYSSSHVLTLSASGSTTTHLVLAVDGVDTLIYDDSATPITNPGRVGLVFQSAALVQSDTRDIQLANWSGIGPIMLGADYKPKAAGGFRVGGSTRGPTVASLRGVGGVKLGGAITPSRTVGVPASGGFRVGGVATNRLNHAYSQSGSGGFGLGGFATRRTTTASSASGGFAIGGKATAIGRYTPPRSGGMRFGGAVAASGSRTYSVLGTGGFRLGGFSSAASGWTLGASGGVRFGGTAFPRDFTAYMTGGMRLGGGKLPIDFRDDATGGMRFGGWGSFHEILYNIYVNDGHGGPVDYTAPIVTTSRLSYRVGPLVVPGDYTWHVRTYDASTHLEEQNIDARVRVILDAQGNDITGQPAAPSSLAARALASGDVTLSWLYRTPSGRNRPSEFRIYCGTPAVSYAAPVLVVPYSSDRMYWCRIPSLEDGQPYKFVVRAANGVAEEPNTSVVAATPDATGPRPVDDLVISAV